MYSFGGWPLFSEYILISTSNICTFWPVSARYFGVSGKNSSHAPVSNAGSEHMNTNRFQEWKVKLAIMKFTSRGMMIQPTPEDLNRSIFGLKCCVF